MVIKRDDAWCGKSSAASPRRLISRYVSLRFVWVLLSHMEQLRNNEWNIPELGFIHKWHKIQELILVQTPVCVCLSDDARSRESTVKGTAQQKELETSL